MDLYLIRHADALALGERGITEDAERPLSEKGEGQARAAALAMRKVGITLDRLYTSPLLRARQTTELLVKTWDGSGLEPVLCKELEPGTKPRKLSKFLLKQEGEKVGLVGHMPDLGEYAAWLLGCKDAQIDLAKAGVAHIACGEAPSKGHGSLQLLVTPDWYAAE